APAKLTPHKNGCKPRECWRRNISSALGGMAAESTALKNKPTESPTAPPANTSALLANSGCDTHSRRAATPPPILHSAPRECAQENKLREPPALQKSLTMRATMLRRVPGGSSPASAGNKKTCWLPAATTGAGNSTSPNAR